MPARTRQSIEAQDTRQRVWDSLDYGYGKKKEDLTKQYDQAFSQNERNALAKGMGRSSYVAQTGANLRNQQAKAVGDVDTEMAADYANRLYQIERDEKQDELQRAQIAATTAAASISANASMKNAELQHELAMAQLAENARQFDLGLASNKEESALERAWKTGERIGQQDFQSGESSAQRGWQSGESALDRAFQSGESSAQRAWQGEQNAADRTLQLYDIDENSRLQQAQMAQADRQFTYNFNADQQQRADDNAYRQQTLAYQGLRDAQADAQWAYDKQTSNEQWQAEFMAQYLSPILAAGGTPTDQLLAQAGLSRADYNAMVQKLGDSGGGSSSSSGSRSSGSKKDTTPVPTDAYLQGLIGGQTLKMDADAPKLSGMTAQLASKDTDKDKASTSGALSSLKNRSKKDKLGR